MFLTNTVLQISDGILSVYSWTLYVISTFTIFTNKKGNEKAWFQKRRHIFHS